MRIAARAPGPTAYRRQEGDLISFMDRRGAVAEFLIACQHDTRFQIGQARKIARVTSEDGLDARAVGHFDVIFRPADNVLQHTEKQHLHAHDCHSNRRSVRVRVSAFRHATIRLMRRLALLVLSALGLLSGLEASGAALPPEADRQLAREIYKEMIEIRSGYSTGTTTPVAEAVAARLRAAGFPDADIFVGGASPKKANLVVRYHGSGARRPILLLAHTDVVEANREDWSTDPFQFIEKDGYFYGRGTADDKAQAAVWIANLIRYKREGYKPARDIIVALTADEEGGGPYNGVTWLLKNKRELIDAELALNEGGGGVMVDGNKIANNIQVSEKSYADFKFEVRNKGGHSSVPVPDNAIYRLAAALERLSRYSFPLKTDEVTRAYFRKWRRWRKDRFERTWRRSPTDPGRLPGKRCSAWRPPLRAGIRCCEPRASPPSWRVAMHSTRCPNSPRRTSIAAFFRANPSSRCRRLCGKQWRTIRSQSTCRATSTWGRRLRCGRMF